MTPRAARRLALAGVPGWPSSANSWSCTATGDWSAAFGDLAGAAAVAFYPPFWYLGRGQRVLAVGSGRRLGAPVAYE